MSLARRNLLRYLGESLKYYEEIPFVKVLWELENDMQESYPYLFEFQHDNAL